MMSRLPYVFLALAGRTLAQANIGSSPYWHEQYHGCLSMAAYGDYMTECPRFFTQESLLRSFPSSTEAPWTLLSNWGPTASVLEGFNVVIPEMDKVVMVFKGLEGWQNLNQTAVPPTAFNLGDACAGCLVHAGAYQAYLEAKAATNNWEVVATSVAANGHQWSLTGHGFGGMVAQIAALDLGWQGKSHWLHSHGAPRCMNGAAATLIEKLYSGEASQRTVANEDSYPNLIPESADFTHTLQGFHIFGTNSTFGMNYEICGTDRNDPRCLGGNVASDHYFYYTEWGTCCGDYSDRVYNQANNLAAQSQAMAQWAATAAVSTIANLSAATSSSSSSSTSASATSTSLASVSSTSSSSSTSARPSSKSTSSGANSVHVSCSLLVALVGLIMAMVHMS